MLYNIELNLLSGRDLRGHPGVDLSDGSLEYVYVCCDIIHIVA